MSVTLQRIGESGGVPILLMLGGLLMTDCCCSSSSSSSSGSSSEPSTSEPPVPPQYQCLKVTGYLKEWDPELNDYVWVPSPAGPSCGCADISAMPNYQPGGWEEEPEELGGNWKNVYQPYGSVHEDAEACAEECDCESSSSSSSPSEQSTSEPSQPSTSEPSASEPSTSEPSTSEPSTSEPSTSEPSASQPSTSEPSASEPSTSEPSTSEPSGSTPGPEFPGAGWYSYNGYWDFVPDEPGGDPPLGTWGPVSKAEHEDPTCDSLRLFSVQCAYIASQEEWDAYHFGECQDFSTEIMWEYQMNTTDGVRYDTQWECAGTEPP